MGTSITKAVDFGDRYRVHCLLGAGGMGVVYRGTTRGDFGFERRVAIKKMVPRTRDEADRMMRALENEAALGGRLGANAHIVQTLDVGMTADGHPFIVMELVQGWTLDKLVQFCREHELRLPSTVIAEILMQICKGLHHVHEHGNELGVAGDPVHRDLKPENIMVGRDGTAKLLDFGIVKAESNVNQTTAADTTKGTPAYMSPEQVTGSEDLDRRSDIFALGAVLCYAVTGQPPFAAPELVALLRQVYETNVEPAVERIRAVAPEFVAVFQACCQREPSDRPASAMEVERMLRPMAEHGALADWLEEHSDLLPGFPADGDWGPMGTPQAVQIADAPHGTQSLDPPPGATRQYPADRHDGETAFVFAETGTAPVQAVPQPHEVGLDAVYLRPGERLDGKRRRKAKAGVRPIHLAVAAAGMALLGVAIIAAVLLQGPTAPVVEATSLPAEPLNTAPAVDDLPSMAPAEAIAEPATPAPTRAVRKGEARTERQPTPRAIAEPATPAPSTEAPEAVPQGTGRVTLASFPYSTVTVDGKPVGKPTPIENLELPAGVHTVVFTAGDGSGDSCTTDVEVPANGTAERKFGYASKPAWCR